MCVVGKIKVRIHLGCRDEAGPYLRTVGQTIWSQFFRILGSMEKIWSIALAPKQKTAHPADATK